MTPVSIPWGGTTPNDAGPYSDEDWRKIYMNMLGVDWFSQPSGAGVDLNEFIGVFQRFLEGMRVEASSPAGASVDIRPGSAVCYGAIVHNATAEQVAIAANASGNPRKDYVVLRVLPGQKRSEFGVRTGTPAASPVPPAIVNTISQWEIPLAIVNAANGFVTITQANIEDARLFADFSPGVMIKLLNNSGTAIEPGRIVRLATGTDSAMSYCPRNESDDMIGVSLNRVANGDHGFVVTEGIVYMKAGGAITRGDRLTPSGTPIDGTAIGIDLGRYIARALASANSGEFFPAYVRRNDEREVVNHEADSVTGSDFTTASAAYVDTSLRLTTFTKYLTDSVLEFDAQLLMAISADGQTEEVEIRNYTAGSSYVPQVALSTATGGGGGVHSKAMYRRVTGLASGTYDIGLRCRTTGGTARINIGSRFEIKEVKY